MKKVLVFIPFLNAEKYVEKQLNLLINQTVNVDILIIDSGSTDNTLKIILDYKNKYENIFLEQIKKKEFNHGLTRNKVLKFKNYEYYLFLTQDALPYDEKLIENLLNCFFFKKNIKIAYARQIPYEDSDLIEKLSRNFNYGEKTIIKNKKDIKTLGIKTFFTSNSCCMYDGEYFRQENGFKKTNVSEDMLFAYETVMKNYDIIYCSKAKVYHSHYYTLNDLHRRYCEIGNFFSKNRYLLNFSVNVEGIKYFKYVLFHLLKDKKYFEVIKFFVYIIMKKIAFNKGKRYFKKNSRYIN